MKKLLNVLILVLAANFLLIAGAVGWMFQSGKLDKERIAAVRELLFPAEKPPEVVTTQPTTRPADEPSIVKLDELLSKYAGRRTGEQVELIQQSIDAQAITLDRRSRELDSLMKQILREKEELALRSQTLEAQNNRLVEQEKAQVALASDKGFQDSLKLYIAMPGKQAKSAFMSMPDEMVVRYLQAMPPRAATKVIKEFKSPPEQDRINQILDQMRRGGASPSTQPSDDGSPPAAPAVPAAATAAAAPRE